MFEAINTKNPLVVLDDPISSYDYDKRYGILYALFSKEGSCFKKNLSSCTVLVMTHDFLVVSDLIRIPGQNMKQVSGKFLSCDRGGVLHAQDLGKEALTPYTQMLYKQIAEAADKPEIIQLVIIRQLCEQLWKSPGDGRTREAVTFDLLSNIIHGHDAEAEMERSGQTQRDCRKVEICQNYVIVRQMLLRDESLGGSHIMKRFADETCHLGGSYLYQLDGRAYDQVPFYVVEWCDEVAARARERYCQADAAGGR